MNRRGFFALLGVATVAPKALKLAPVPVALPTVDPFFGIDRTFAPTGIQGWLPTSVAGRLDWIADMREQGLLSTDDAMKAIGAPE